MGFSHSTGAQKHLKSRLPPVPSLRKELPYALNASNHSALQQQPKGTQHGVYWAINIPLAHYPPMKCQTDDLGTVLFYSSHSQGEKPNLPAISPAKGSGIPVLEVSCSTSRAGAPLSLRRQNHPPSNQRDGHFKKEERESRKITKSGFSSNPQLEEISDASLTSVEVR